MGVAKGYFPSYMVWEKWQNFNPIMALHEKLQFILKGTRMSDLNFMVILPIVARTFQINHKCECHGNAGGKVRGSPESLGYII